MLECLGGRGESPVLKGGGEIKKGGDTQGMEMVFNSLGKITADIQAVTSSLRGTLAGEQEASLPKVIQNAVQLSTSVDASVLGSTPRPQGRIPKSESANRRVPRVTLSDED